ncbi:MAG TPA: VOC family protein [bacterium]|jgi:uncharacterized glyoxalase superfamily protein PhnB|nr:VOC family protein [bacterium]
MSVNPVPEGYPALMPYLVVHGVNRLIDFVEQAFGAAEIGRVVDAAGQISHAGVTIGDAVVEMGEAGAEWPAMSGGIHYYVEDTGAVYRKALEAGAISIQEPTDMPYGERSAAVKDPSGNHWYIATRTEELAPEWRLKKKP